MASSVSGPALRCLAGREDQLGQQVAAEPRVERSRAQSLHVQGASGAGTCNYLDQPLGVRTPPACAWFQQTESTPFLGISEHTWPSGFAPRSPFTGGKWKLREKVLVNIWKREAWRLPHPWCYTGDWKNNRTGPMPFWWVKVSRHRQYLSLKSRSTSCYLIPQASMSVLNLLPLHPWTAVGIATLV